MPLYDFKSKHPGKMKSRILFPDAKVKNFYFLQSIASAGCRANARNFERFFHIFQIKSRFVLPLF
jgi:hypothetical protein